MILTRQRYSATVVLAQRYQKAGFDWTKSTNESLLPLQYRYGSTTGMYFYRGRPIHDCAVPFILFLTDVLFLLVYPCSCLGVLLPGCST